MSDEIRSTFFFTEFLGLSSVITGIVLASMSGEITKDAGNCETWEVTKNRVLMEVIVTS